MFTTRCLLAVVALYVGLAHSWDIAVTSGDHIDFFINGVKIHTESVQLSDLTALAYDPVHNMLLFVDKQSENASIFSFSMSSKKYQSLVKRKAYENIQGLAFDPVTGLLFWTDSNERTINSISLKPGSKNNVYGNLLFKMDDEIPRAIAVDSCRGYVYWTNINPLKPTIERARFNGTEREVVVDSEMYMPVSLAIDQQTKQMYWADDIEGIQFSIESADLNGKNRTTLLVGVLQHPNALTVSKDSIYWVDWGYNSVWQLPKNPAIEEQPKEITYYKSETPFGIVANYTIEDQTKGTIECDISVCQNYCFQGDCSVSGKGQPKCRCNAGYSGKRCEVYACHNYCLNDGACSLKEEDEPVCQCAGHHKGSRCETVKDVTFNINNVAPTYYSAERNLKLAALLANSLKVVKN